MVFDSLKQCEAQTGWPVDKLKLAKHTLGAEGFKSNRIHWESFQEWYSKPSNKAALDAVYELETGGTNKSTDNRPIEEIERNHALQQEILNDLKIKKESSKYVDPDETITFLIGVHKVLDGSSRKWASELPRKLIGKSEGEIEVILAKERVQFIQMYLSALEKTFGIKDINGTGSS